MNIKKLNLSSKDKVIGGAVIVGGVLLYGLYNKFFGKTQAEKDQENKDKEAERLKKIELDKELKKANLTRPESDYYTAANVIHDSLKYATIDDDANAAQRAFTSIINNNADLAFLNVVYGSRNLYNFGYNLGSFGLIATLSKEFSNSRKAETVNILAKKGVYINL